MPIDIKLETFKGQLKDGARPNRFAVTITGRQGTEGASWSDNPMSFLVKSFVQPSRTIGEINLKYQGMETKLAGDVTYDDVTMVLHMDYEMRAKKYIQDWMNGIALVDKDTSNTRSAPEEYKAEIKVEQLGRTGEVLSTMILVGAWPKQMDSIDLSHENTDQIEDQSVTFAIDYWYMQ